MELSRSIKEKIKAWEGCRLVAYRCPAGVWTIGYGHTGRDVTPGKRITQAEADALFETDIAKFASTVEPVFEGVELSGCQFDALVSLSYNIGSLPKKAPTLVAKVKANPNDPTIRKEFAKFMYASIDGERKVLSGLVKRRAAEVSHYFGKVW